MELSQQISGAILVRSLTVWPIICDLHWHTTILNIVVALIFAAKDQCGHGKLARADLDLNPLSMPCMEHS